MQALHRIGVRVILRRVKKEAVKLVAFAARMLVFLKACVPARPAHLLGRIVTGEFHSCINCASSNWVVSFVGGKRSAS